ncbi:Conserved oligomeric Golgi complex subunit 3 [Grifola frondosa]|uniref:Conserved oligomeric Golgi complex subunit 3 n=1 Tax=Grifola frondosa TaxID=5627 RepID=A0A1C7M2K2_GRIFR|nr:Conserved oligomeric Golgi complex subunit 3 [Grifola frondosa]
MSSLPEDEDADADELNLDLDHTRHGKMGLRTLHISHLLQMVLQDAQTRLFFKAQAVIQAEIRYYIPKAEDLAYPEKLVAARKILSGADLKEKESVSQLFQLKSLDKQDTWFPTLRKTVWVLSQLHEYVKRRGDAEVEEPTIVGIGGQLFLTRHLLILKEMTQNLDLVQKDVDRGIDLSGVTDTLASMLGKTTSLLPNALFASLGMPRDENMTDVRHGIDLELKRACEDVISSCAEPACAPLRSARAARGAAVGVASHSHGAHRRVPPGVARDLRAAVARLRLYLEDDRTVGVLVRHVQDRIVDECAEFRAVVWDMYAGALRTELGSEDGVRAMLIEICEEHGGADAATATGSGLQTASAAGTST